ncbi:MAG: hypothetical protein WBP12_01335 [Candidatus Saccharimonas sp.]
MSAASARQRQVAKGKKTVERFREQADKARASAERNGKKLGKGSGGIGLINYSGNARPNSGGLDPRFGVVGSANYQRTTGQVSQKKFVSRPRRHKIPA